MTFSHPGTKQSSIRRVKNFGLNEEECIPVHHACPSPVNYSTLNLFLSEGANTLQEADGKKTSGTTADRLPGVSGPL